MAGSDGLWGKIKDNAFVQGAAGAMLFPIAPTVGGSMLASAGGKLAKDAQNPARPVKTSKEMLAADLKTMTTNPAALGMTDAQRQKMVDEATQASAMQRQGQVAQLGQQALAGQGFQQGAFEQAQQNIAQGVGADTAAASMSVGQLNQQIIDSEKNRIRADLDAARQRAKENAIFWTQFGLDSAATIAQTMAGL